MVLGDGDLPKLHWTLANLACIIRQQCLMTDTYSTSRRKQKDKKNKTAAITNGRKAGQKLKTNIESLNTRLICPSPQNGWWLLGQIA